MPNVRPKTQPSGRVWRTVADWAKNRPSVLRIADRLGRGRGRLRWLDGALHVPRMSRPVSLDGWADHDLAALWIGHATVLLRVGGMTILTDPVFSRRVGLDLGVLTVGPLRMIEPALRPDRLPKIDLILVSHAHFDHLDRPTLNRLDKSVPVITARGCGDLIADLGFAGVREIAWGQRVAVRRPADQAGASAGVTITAREVKHWGARTFYDDYRRFNAFVIDGGGRRVFFGGDTAWYPHFADLRPIDLAIIGIGAYDPYHAVHANPEEAWAMARQMGAARVLPIHHKTFRLSYEPVNDPIARLLAAAGTQRRKVVGTRPGAVWYQDQSGDGG